MNAPKFRKCLMRLIFLSICVLVPSVISIEAEWTAPDPRISKVDAFFHAYSCPAPNHAADYVRAADLYDIDYRILPAISLLESTCGSYPRGNNHWGWDNGSANFRSVEHGIDYIARQLSQAGPYKDRDLDGKLFSYNPRRAYVHLARRLIQEIEAH